MNKINRILIVILLIFLTAVISTAVPVSTVNKILDVPNAEAFTTTPDGGYIFAGSYETYASISKTDKDGNLLWRNDYDVENGSRFSSITSYYQGGYVAIGTSGVELHNDDDEWLYSGLIVRIDDDGNEIWRKYVQRGNFLSFKKITETWYGFVIVGDYMDTDWNPQSIYMLEINSNGDELFDKMVTNSTTFDYVSDVKQTFNKNKITHGIDRGLIVTGSTSDGKDGLIIKISDTSGEIQWSKTLKGMGHVSSILQLSSEYYIATGYLENEYPNPKNSWIMKLSKNGKIKWTKYISKGVYNEINSVKQTKGGYILTGTLYGNDNEPNGGMLIRTDKRGKELWTIVPGDNVYSKLYDVIESTKKNYTSFGFKCNSDTNECGTYFVKIRDMKSPNN